MRVEVEVRHEAEPGEARLRVARHEHRRVADGVAIDPPRFRDPRDRALDIVGRDVLLEIGERARRALQDFVRDGLHVVAGQDRAVQRRCPDGKALREMQLEFAQTRETQCTAEADDRRRAHLRAAGERVDVAAQREIRIGEHGRRDLLLSVRQRSRALADREQEVAHRRMGLVAASGRTAHGGRVRKTCGSRPSRDNRRQR